MLHFLKKLLKFMSDLFTPSSNGLQNDYTNIPDVPVSPDSDRVIPRQVASGMSRGIQQLGSDKVYSDGGNNQIIVEDTSTPRVLMGNQATFGQGFYVSKSGTNVKTNTNAANFIFNSNQNVFKIVQKIPTQTAQFTTTYNGTSTSGGTLLTVPHGQTFTPVVEVYVQANILNYNTAALIASSYVPLPIFPAQTQSFNSYVFPNASAATNYFGVSVIYGVDATNVYVQAAFFLTGNSADTMAAIPVTIFLLQETAS